jgi:hypothetical protein
LRAIQEEGDVPESTGSTTPDPNPHRKYTTDQTESQIQKSAIHTRGLWEERTCACEDLPEFKEYKIERNGSIPHMRGRKKQSS